MAIGVKSFTPPWRANLLVWFATLIIMLFAPIAPAQDSPGEVEKSSLVALLNLINSAMNKAERNEFDGAIEDLEKALLVTQGPNDVYHLATIQISLGYVYLKKGDETAAHKSFDSAVAIYKDIPALSFLENTLTQAVQMGRDLDSRPTQLRYLSLLANFYAEQSKTEQQIAALEKKLDLLIMPGDVEIARGILVQLLSSYQQINNEEAVAKTLAGLAFCHEVIGDFEGALIKYKEAITQYRKIGNKVLLSRMLNKLSEDLRSRGRYTEALPFQEEATSIRRTLDDDRALAVSLNNRAILHQDLGNHPQAAKDIEESLTLIRKFGNKSNIAQSLNNAASIYRDLGRFKEAKAFLDEVFQIARDEKLFEYRKRAAQIMATIYHAEGNRLMALAMAELGESLPVDGDIDEIRKTELQSHNVGVMLLEMHYYEKAIEIFEEELRKAKALDDKLSAASAHEGLAIAYEAKARYNSSESHLLNAIQIREQLQDPMGLNNALNSLAGVYVSMGRYYDALDRYRTSQDMLATVKAPRRRVEVLLATAQIYRHLKSYEQAQDDAEQALILSQEYGYKTLTAQAQRALGVIYLQSGDFERAEQFYRDAEVTDPAKSLSVFSEQLVEVFLATGRYDEARKELEKVTPELLGEQSSTYRLQYLTQRGIMHFGVGEMGNAFSDFKQAIKIVEKQRNQFKFDKSSGFFHSGAYGGRIRPYRGMIETLALVALSDMQATITINDQKHDPVSAAFHFSELMRGRNLTEWLAMIELVKVTKILPESIRAKHACFHEQTMKLAREIQARKDRGEDISPEQLEAFNRLRKDAKEHLAMLRLEYPHIAFLLSPSVISHDQLPLADREVVLEYAIGLQDVFLFIKKQGQGLRLIKLPISIRDLQNEVEVFLDLLVARRYSIAIGKNLFDELLGEAIKYIEPEDTLIIVPDGFLGLLPFEALVMEQNDKKGKLTFFGEQRHVSYTQSAAIMSLNRNYSRARAEKPFFALADPVFSKSDRRFVERHMKLLKNKASDSKSEESVPDVTQSQSSFQSHRYKRLSETQLEVETLASIKGIEPRPPDVLTGIAANESKLRSTDLSAYRILHFATHAEALGQLGFINEPFLVLGQFENKAEHDGMLTMSEIMELKLNAELVVLAACDTGRGDVFEGEGVASLASAFQFAGTQSVLLSLWELPSQVSLNYMETFYKHLEEGLGKVKALQLSKDKMRKQYSEPYYWAVFILYGAARL